MPFFAIHYDESCVRLCRRRMFHLRELSAIWEHRLRHLQCKNSGVQNNTLCHVEIESSDLDKSQAFYEGVFGWTFKSFMGGQMRIFGVGDHHIGGLMLVDKVNPGSSPSLWFKVDSLEGAVARVTANGGTEVSPASPVPGVGFSSQVKDPEGNLVGLVEYTD